ncbi:MAG: efflux RND transporter periplasmic adaptor subunit [Candidatus Omnitrophica bacterium]|nr:efflux RND transporter periplasmic adaptor subunit [Candidatus Omnitrophota bacterium]
MGLEIRDTADSKVCATKTECVSGFAVRILLFICAFLLFCGCEEKPKPRFPPPVVEVMTVVQSNVPVYHEWVGTLDGSVNAQIRAQVTGYLLTQDYREGSFVRKGDLLFTIDPRPFQAILNQAKGQLAQAEAQFGKTELDVKRYTPLAKKSAISEEELDDAVQANLAAKAAVLTAKAVVETSELDLGFTRIASPIDGIAGIAQAQVGDLVGPGAVGNLTTVSTVDPIRAYISISEQEYLGAAVSHTPLEKMSLELILANGSLFPHRGHILFANRQVNTQTGTITVEANFDNPGNILRPGQFARVRALMETKEGALLVPQRAVNQFQGGYQVAIVGPDDKVDIRAVRPGERIGTLWMIEEGIKPGERVVAEGFQKIRHGMIVTPKPFVEDTVNRKSETRRRPGNSDSKDPAPLAGLPLSALPAPAGTS